MFDQCPQAIEDAKDNTLNDDNVEYIDQSTMQDFNFDNRGEINAIFLRWCLGYLIREEQLTFLKKAAKALKNEPGRYSRSNGPSSYVIIMDNIDDEMDRKEPIS